MAKKKQRKGGAGAKASKAARQALNAVPHAFLRPITPAAATAVTACPSGDSSQRPLQSLQSLQPLMSRYCRFDDEIKTLVDTTPLSYTRTDLSGVVTAPVAVSSNDASGGRSCASADHSMQMVLVELKLVNWRYMNRAFWMRETSTLHSLVPLLTDTHGLLSELRFFRDPPHCRNELNNWDTPLSALCSIADGRATDPGFPPPGATRPQHLTTSSAMQVKRVSLYYDFTAAKIDPCLLREPELILPSALQHIDRKPTSARIPIEPNGATDPYQPELTFDFKLFAAVPAAGETLASNAASSPGSPNVGGNAVTKQASLLRPQTSSSFAARMHVMQDFVDQSMTRGQSLGEPSVLVRSGSTLLPRASTVVLNYRSINEGANTSPT